jgi:class 3 adenylate cyclase
MKNVGARLISLLRRAVRPSPRRATTRIVTVVVTGLGRPETVDPEELLQIWTPAIDVISAEVDQFDGTVAQFTEEGIRSVFGLCITREDDPRRAVLAALGIQRGLRQYRRELEERRGSPLDVRIGLNTGPEAILEMGKQLYELGTIGEPSHLAARLSTVARSGSVVVSETTHRAIAGFFDTVDLGEVTVSHSPVRAFEVLRPRGQP